MEMVAANNSRRGERLRSARPGLGSSMPWVVPGASWYSWWKTPVEWFFALMVLLLSAPLILLAVVLVKLTSKGPVLYSQSRLGRHGWPFVIYKIRTMYYQCESLTGARWSTPGDKRITPVGRWLRRTHLDELPQLWNVLKGEMSLIGPRPERPEFVPQLEQAIPQYRARFLALVREAGDRALDMRPFDVQLQGALRLLAGATIEMATGEGKTLAGAIAAIGYVLQGHRVHVVSVNTMWREGKKKRTRNAVGRRASQKRAVVTLAEGDKIEIFQAK